MKKSYAYIFCSALALVLGIAQETPAQARTSTLFDPHGNTCTVFLDADNIHSASALSFIPGVIVVLDGPSVVNVLPNDTVQVTNGDTFTSQKTQAFLQDAHAAKALCTKVRSSYRLSAN